MSGDELVRLFCYMVVGGTVNYLIGYWVGRRSK